MLKLMWLEKLVWKKVYWRKGLLVGVATVVVVAAVAVAVAEAAAADNPDCIRRTAGCRFDCSLLDFGYKHYIDCILVVAVGRRQDNGLDHDAEGIVVHTEDIRHIAAVGKPDQV